jgi:hypothetical protein
MVQDKEEFDSLINNLYTILRWIVLRIGPESDNRKVKYTLVSALPLRF